MKVIVAGAAGAVGKLLVEALVTDGHEVVGLVHSEDKKAKVADAGAAPVMADVTDRATLEAPVDGADAVIFAAGSGGKAVEAVDRDGAINLIDVAQQAGVPRFVMLSSMAAGEPDRGPDELKDYLVAKGAADDHLAKSGIAHVIVCPGTLNDEAGSGTIRVDPQDGLDGGEIPRADVARTLASVATREPFGDDTTFTILSGDRPIAEALAARLG